MTPVVVIRPEPGCAATVAAARALGLDVRGFPLFEVRPVEWEPPDPAQFDALLIGSANVLRHGGAALAAYRHLPVYAVGEATGREAMQAGFAKVTCGQGGLQSMLGRIAPEHQRILRLSARERVSLSPPDATSIEERIVYESAPLSMPDELAALLHKPALVLLHSGEAARHFAGQCDSHGIDRSVIAIAALAPRIAEVAGPGWAQVRVAQEPNDAALLALARDMCQTPPNP